MTPSHMKNAETHRECVHHASTKLVLLKAHHTNATCLKEDVPKECCIGNLNTTPAVYGTASAIADNEKRRYILYADNQ